MLAKRIIPCLDVDNGRVVKGVNFLNLIDAGDPVNLARFYNRQGADELIFLDIKASSDNRELMLGVVKKVAREVFIPLTVGGGIRSIDDILATLSAGADKVSINSAAVKNPQLIAQSANKFGSQCIVLAVDVKKIDGRLRVFIHGGRIETNLDALEWIKQAAKFGAGEILLTSMDSDGTKTGFNLDLTKAISSQVSIPVIASGGAGSMDDFVEVFQKGAADGALAASLFHSKSIEIADLKKYLLKKGVSVRYD